MAESNFRGPVTSMGALEIQGGTAANIEPTDGPSAFYQGICIPDIRSVPFAKDGTAPARQPAFQVTNSITTVDAIPQTFSSTALSASASVATTSPVTVTLRTIGLTNPNPASQFLAVGVPIIPQGTSAVVTTALALDFGFTTGTTTTNSSTVQVPDNTQFQVGQWIVIGNAGNSGATASLLTQVALVSSDFTTLKITGLAGTAMCAPIGAANLFGSSLLPPATQFGPSAPAPNAHSSRSAAGLVRVMNPREMLARCVSLSVTAIASTSGTVSVTVNGYDVWGQAMSESISATVATTTLTNIFGQKAFKYVTSVTGLTLTTTATVSIGMGDTFGLPLRADYPQQCAVNAGNTAIVNQVGFTAAVSTAGSPATATTGDVRGTWQLSGQGASTPISNVATSNGALRLVIVQRPTVWQQINATPLNTVPMFGVTQA